MAYIHATTRSFYQLSLEYHDLYYSCHECAVDSCREPTVTVAGRNTVGDRILQPSNREDLQPNCLGTMGENLQDNREFIRIFGYCKYS